MGSKSLVKIGQVEGEMLLLLKNVTRAYMAYMFPEQMWVSVQNFGFLACLEVVEKIVVVGWSRPVLGLSLSQLLGLRLKIYFGGDIASFREF